MGGHEHGAVEGALKGPRGTLACFNVHRVSSFEVQSPAGPVSQFQALESRAYKGRGPGF